MLGRGSLSGNCSRAFPFHLSFPSEDVWINWADEDKGVTTSSSSEVSGEDSPIRFESADSEGVDSDIELDTFYDVED